MFRGNHLQVAGKAAILATLLGGSSMAFAQEAAPVVVQPTVAPPVQQAPAPQPAPVVTPEAAPAVTPPAVVRTIPDAELNRPTAQAEAERPAPRRRAAAVAPRATPRAEGAPAAPAAAPVVVNEPTVVTDPLPVEESGDITATVEDRAAIVPVAEPAADTSGMATEDWTLAGGIAAVLAALGLGALAMRRRRRAVNDNEVQTVAVVPAAASEYPAPRPISQDPVFQRPAPIAEPAIQHPTSIPVAEPVIQRRPLMTRPDVPVTDPLFSHKVSAPPITDPMFAPKTAVELPITDPLFAKHDRFTGRTRPADAVPARESELIN